MAKKPTPKKVAAKKPAAVVKKSPLKAKPVPKPKPVAKKPAPKPAAKPAIKAPAKPAPAKPAPKAAPKPAAKPEVKAAPVAKPAPNVKNPAPAPAPAPVAAAAPVIAAPAPLPAARLAPKTTLATAGSLSLSVQTSQGAAGNGNTHPANLLVVITSGGEPVVDLNKDHFTLMEHFEIGGSGSSFSNNITSFRNAGTGAYLLQTKPSSGAPWRSGHHLGQLLVSSDDDRQGQAAIKIIIR
jgi:hypothetical protein